MLRFPLYFTVREAGGWQGSLISASPSGVSGRLSPIKFCMNRGIAVLSTRELTSLIQTFFFSFKKKNKNPTTTEHGEKYTHSFAGMALFVDLILTSSGRLKDVQWLWSAQTFVYYPQMNFFDVPLTTSVFQPSWVALHFSLSKDLVYLSRIWHPHLITE